MAVELAPGELEPLITLGSTYTLEMQFSKAWPVLKRVTKMAVKAGNPDAHVQALTNLVLALLRGAEPNQALKYAKKLYKLNKADARTTEVYAHVRSLAARYDATATKLSLQSKEQFVDTFTQRGPNCPSGKWQLVWNVSKLSSMMPTGEAAQGRAAKTKKKKGKGKKKKKKKDKSKRSPASSATNVGGSGVVTELLNPATAYTSYGEGTGPHFAGEVLSPFRHLYHEHGVYLTRFPPKTGYMWGP